MKKSINNILLFAATLLFLGGCTQNFPELSSDKLPKASEFDIVITVDDDTNVVTFTLKNKGMVPMWIFSDTKPDSSADKNKYAITVNGYSARFRDAGTHMVEVKAYNANGISEGSVIKEFTLKNDYHDPFNASPYINALSNSASQDWVWNSTVAGHFGCGESGSAGLNWWSAGANEKADWSLYDDVLTFTSDGKYTYDPTDGKVYVNKDSGFEPSYYLNDGQDYMAPISKFTVDYSIEQSWNGAGIEEIWLVLPAGKNLSYIPNPAALTNPRYRFLETSVTKMKKEIKLVIDNGSIAWHYEFVPKAKTLTQEDILTGESSKVWIMDAATPGHLGCGETIANPTGWWSAAPYEKTGTALYDDELTFNADGTYTFSPGADGKIYINKDVTVVGASENPHNGLDFDATYAAKTSTWSISDGKLILPADNVIGYLPHNEAYATPHFTISLLTENALELIWYTATGNGGGPIAWHYRFVPRDGTGTKQTFCGEEFTGGKVEMTLTKGQAVTVTGIDLTDTWIDPDFFTINGSDITFAAASGDYSILYDSANKWFKVTPLKDGVRGTWANNKEVWIIGTGGGKPSAANAIGWNTERALPMAKIADNTYQITLSSVANESVKLFGDAGWVGEWGYGSYNSFNGNSYAQLGDGTTGDSGNIYFASVDASKYIRLTAVMDAAGKATMTVSLVSVEGVEKPWTQGDAIDPTQYAHEIVGTWTWEPSTAGHFGCGDSIANPTGWWSAPANDKQGFSLYDDKITFTSGGQYTFDPVDGHTYVNVKVTTYQSSYNTTGQDFVAPASVQSSSYAVTLNDGYYTFTLQANTLLSYLSNNEQLTNCKYYITGMWENCLELVWYTATGNDGGPIAWKYRFKRVD